ncbi:hypothetical protein [Pseudoalteromonas sp. DL2-H2.2]|nr:hypothetical protein [Pseudoalteromonas sp. DL2-H2.2]
MKVIERVSLVKIMGGVSGDPDRSTLPRVAPPPLFGKKAKTSDGG